MIFSLILSALLAIFPLTTGLAVNPDKIYLPRAEKANYMIVPNDGFDTENFQNKLLKTVSESSVYTSQTCQLGILFWATELTSDQATSLEDSSVQITNLDLQYGKRDLTAFDRFHREAHNPMLPSLNDSVNAIDTSLIKRDNINSQTDASTDMKMVSTPKGQSLAAQTAYRYPSSAGGKSTVYIVDTGFAFGQATGEFPREKAYRFIYAYNADKGKTDSNGHGTWVASRIAGKKYGLAKNANLVFVKIDTASSTIWASVLDAVAKIADDIEDNFVSKPIINLSWRLPGQAPGSNVVAKFKEALQYLELSEAVIITSAGNEGKEVYEYPALLHNEISALNVIGAVDSTGQQWASSNTASYVKLYAPAVDITLIGREGTENPGRSGTSYAAAAGSAIAALLYENLDSASDVNNELDKLSWTRVTGGPKVIFNGVQSS